MSTASTGFLPVQPPMLPDEHAEHLEKERATAQALFRMVNELDGGSLSRARQSVVRGQRKTEKAAVRFAAQDFESAENEVADADVSKTFCEWLTSVRALQKNPQDRKKMIASFVMLVFHSGIGDCSQSPNAVNIDILTREQLDFVSRAPGWNQNERRILAVLKDHFHTIQQLSGSKKGGISYADISSLFLSKKKLKERLAMVDADQCGRTGVGIGLTLQVLLIVAALQFGLNFSLLMALSGAVIGIYKEQSLNGAIITGVKGALWGISVGSAVGAVLGANRANTYFQANLSAQIDYMRQDLAELNFEAC